MLPQHQRIYSDGERPFIEREEVTLNKFVKLGSKMDDECSICLESMYQLKIVETPCHHIFHYECIEY